MRGIAYSLLALVLAAVLVLLAAQCQRKRTRVEVVEPMDPKMQKFMERVAIEQRQW